MIKNKNSSNTPTNEDMAELESFYKKNELDSLISKARELIDKFPTNADLYNILGVGLQKKDLHDESILNFENAIKYKHDFDHAHNNLGNVKKVQGKLNEAAQSYKKATIINPNYSIAYNNLGVVLKELGQHKDSINNLKIAIKINPNYAEAYSNLGVTQSEIGEYQEAIENHKKSINLNPKHAEGYSNLGVSLGELGKFEEAKINHQKAIQLNPKYTKALMNESFIRLQCGEFKLGWKLYENRYDNETLPMRYPINKTWNGKYLKGTLLIWGEQGIGDHIFFGSMISDIKKLAGNIILEIDKRLIKLFKDYFDTINFSNIKIISLEKKRTQNFDKHIAIGSLGQFFRNSKESFKSLRKKYLITDKKKENIMKSHLNKKNKKKIGLSWKTLNKKQQFRNISLEKLLPLINLNDFEFVNLQFGETSEDINFIKKNYKINITNIENLDNYNDIDNLAALINSLDLVISIQNTVAHLSSALGKETWILLAKNARWHWTINEKESLWYPTAKLFRQNTMGDWNSVVNDISTEIKKI